MKFELTPEQLALQAMAGDYFASTASLRAAREAYDDPTVWDRAAWRGIAQVGLTGVALPADLGGGDGGVVELAVVLEQAGRHVLPQPLLTSAVAGVMLRECERSTLVEQLMRGIDDGSVVVVPTLDHCAPHASAARNVQMVDGRVSGSIRRVLDATIADVLLIPAADQEQTVLVAVSVAQDGVVRHALPATDSTRPVADVELVEARASIIAVGQRAIDVLVTGRATSWTLLAAESLGAGQACLEQATDYARTRRQFGKPIGSFQAIKHLLADVFVALESGWPTAYYAAAALDSAVADAHTAASVAKDYCTDALMRAARTSIQVHGGIGFTWESDCHLFFKRATVNQAILGDSSEHRRLLLDEILLERQVSLSTADALNR